MNTQIYMELLEAGAIEEASIGTLSNGNLIVTRMWLKEDEIMDELDYLGAEIEFSEVVEFCQVKADSIFEKIEKMKQMTCAKEVECAGDVNELDID